MGVSSPNPNDEGNSINRRQLLVKLGSFMKNSWRRSREVLTDEDDKKGVNIDRHRKHHMFVQFDDEIYVIPNDTNGSSSSSSSSCCVNDDADDESIPTDYEVDERWYQSEDYCRFKKDMILNSLNYINAKRASKQFDEIKYSIQGIEHMCLVDTKIRKRRIAEKRYVYRAICDEQNKQKQSCSYPDMDKFRSVSLIHTKGERDRALSRGNEYARYAQQEQQQNQYNNMRKSPSMKNLFLCRQPAATVTK